MNLCQRVDFQVHSHHSDGGRAPSDLIVRAHDINTDMRALAITDHDRKGFYTQPGLGKLLEDTPGQIKRVQNVSFSDGILCTETADIPPYDSNPAVYENGWPLLHYATVTPIGGSRYVREMYIVQACEITTFWRRHNCRVDLLAYFMPAEDKFFDEAFAKQEGPRRTRAKQIVESVAESQNWNFTIADVDRVLWPARSIYRPHIAKAILNLRDRGTLCERGNGRKITLSPRIKIHEVIRRYIPDEICPKLDGVVLYDTEQAIKNLLEIRAVPVIPWSKDLDDPQLYQLVSDVHSWSDGMMGLEVWNARHLHTADVMRGLAQAFNITTITAGSDYHGQEHDPPDRNHFGLLPTNGMPRDMLERLIKLRLRISSV